MGEGVRSASNLHSHMAQCAALGQHHVLACSAVLCKMLLLMVHSRCWLPWHNTNLLCERLITAQPTTSVKMYLSNPRPTVGAMDKAQQAQVQERV